MLINIWQDFLKIVKEEAGSRVVETWLKAVSLHQWDADAHTVYIKAPNAFVKEWIQSNYTALFQLHLGRLLHVSEPRVIFLNENEQEPKKDISELITIMPAKRSIIPPQVKHALERRGPQGSFGRLNPTYRFDTFVVGSSNSLAYAAAHSIAEGPGSLYNPLFIYGDSGLGKTHLLHAIGNMVQQKNPQSVVLYQTADRFVNEFINAIRFNKVSLFQQKYRALDVLLIDDIQFISNKEQTQEAFFHIFNSLYDSHKQIVFSSDVFPSHIKGLAERLRSRLESGLVTDIHKPPLETKIAILKRKAMLHNEVLTDDVAEYIAQYAHSNIRELEGALIRILAFASLTKQSLSLDLAKKVLGKQQHYKEEVNHVDFEKIVSHVCKYYSYKLSDLRTDSRARQIARVRQIAMYLMKKMTKKS
ncbi:chromosomal replication initiator protein DnaA, partial [Candidatus Babeliales bacterium]|nr:chromosomal replication initiator protein DnaA [Candidatus Babeliales bacterium]